jgi:hypothetical protein
MEIINIIQVDDIEMKITEDTTAVKEGKAVWSESKNMYVMTMNEFSGKLCWRCTHKDGKIIYLGESAGVTGTLWDMFCGSASEVKAEIERLNLEVHPPWDEEFEKMNGN